jgi:hypothetical protein
MRIAFGLLLMIGEISKPPSDDYDDYVDYDNIGWIWNHKRLCTSERRSPGG